MTKNFFEGIKEIIEKDSRYGPDAYAFVMQALWFTQNNLKRKGHISARELLEGIKEFGLEQYGPMTKTVFQHWGIKTTDGFGEIVFNMVENGILSKTDEDSRRDFKDVYDFAEALNVYKNHKVKDKPRKYNSPPKAGPPPAEKFKT